MEVYYYPRMIRRGIMFESFFLKFVKCMASVYLSECLLAKQVFSAFGFVHKITTFEKTAGFQVYIS